MLKSLIALSVLAMTLVGIAEDPKKTSEKAPELSNEILTQYFKAATQQAQAQIALDRAQKDLEARTQSLQQVIAQINAACGDKFVPTMSPQGDPVCVAKPQAPLTTKQPDPVKH